MSDALTMASIAAGLAAIGGALDYLVDAKEKAKIRAWLEPRLDVFYYTTLQTFGRREMMFSIRILRKLVGRRLLSVHRAISALGVMCVAVAWTVAVVAYEYPTYDLGGIWDIAQVVFTPRHEDDMVMLLMQPILLASVALSFSLSLLLCRVAIRYPFGRTIGGVLALLGAHLLLLVAWPPFVNSTRVLIFNLLVLAVNRDLEWSDWGVMVLSAGSEISSSFQLLTQIGLGEWLLKHYWPVERLLSTSGPMGFSIAMMGLLTNTLRVVLSGIFLLLLVYVKIIRRLVVRLGNALLRPDAALFTPPLVGLGALLVFLERLPAIIRSL